MRKSIRAGGWLCAIATALLACQSQPKQPTTLPAETVRFAEDREGKTSPLARQLTDIGENGEAYFSPDGARVLFHSKDRPAHAHTQVYEVHLATMKERRITHHDGEDTNAIYDPSGAQVLYSSTTDEIKEDPEFISKVMKSFVPGWQAPKSAIGGMDFQPYEIYLVPLDNRDSSLIKRLTTSPKYDAEASFDPKGRRIVFVSVRNGQPDLFTMQADGKIVAQLTKGPEYDSSPFFDPQGEGLVWARFSRDLKSSQVFIANANTMQALPLTTKNAIHFSPFWHPNGQEIVFSSNRAGVGNFDLYVIDRRGLCLKRLTEAKGDEILPSFSPDGRQLLFTSNKSGRYQVYMMEYRPPKACLDQLP